MFLRGLNKLGRKELEREARGRPPLHSGVAHALFDIIDENNNNQITVRLESRSYDFKHKEIVLGLYIHISYAQQDRSYEICL